MYRASVFSSFFVALVFICINGFVVRGSEVKGSLDLDKFNFDKIVGNQHFNVLVKFDKQYAYGAKEDAWKDFATRIGELTTGKDFLLATVSVQDFGEKKNDDLRERFNIDAEAFPVFKLFKKGSSEGIDVSDEITADGLSRFVKREIGLWIGLPGTLEIFDKWATNFLGASADERKDRLSQAEKALGEVQAADKDSAAAYVNAMKKIIGKGTDFVGTETKRVQKLIDGKLSPEKKKQMRNKINILAAFTN